MEQPKTTDVRDERAELRAARMEAEVFINAVPSILIGLNHESRITRWNLSAAAAFGLPAEAVTGKPLTECGIRWVRPGMQKEIQSWFSGRTRRCDEVPFERNGETRLLGLTITPVAASEDQTELLIIGSDTTDRNAMEEQRRQAQKLESVG